MIAISIANLYLSYGRVNVLQDISLEIRSGDFFIIIGPNGTGKTTILKTMAGVAGKFRGEIEVIGKKLAACSPRELARVIAVVPQQMPLDFPFTVAETILMGRSPHLGMLGLEGPADYELTKQAMEFTDVAHLADRRLDQLSGGERQRVIIARAICQQPKIILLDEPTASLDPAHQIKIMDLMEQLRQDQGMTIVMVSHDLNLAAMYGNRLLLLNNGKVDMIGSPQAVLTGANLERTYGCTMQVEENILGNVPRVTPVPNKFKT
ncbi:MAG: ABC transporter ATP-binding protein [Proteobacteria bacterium]|nr:ABC transporter ATP-binding protein [Pseudomonadota bacterium]MBU1715261.1 ABC transporter ATP-binding protein [Pseudomonadota bacterium]